MDENAIKIDQFPEPVKSILSKGERVDLVPVKNNEVRVFRVRREEVKNERGTKRSIR